MTVLFIEYPTCSTCQKAKDWLIKHNISFKERHIVEENPTSSELKQWLSITNKPLKSFFNTSGLLYKSMDLKNRLPAMTEDECLDQLARNGMLVKRPLIIGNTFVLIGFKEVEWQAELLK